MFKFQQSNGGFERAVHKMESSFRMRNVGFSVFLTCILPCSTAQMKDIRLPKVKCVTHAVKMVDSCSRESGSESSVHCSMIMVIVPS